MIDGAGADGGHPCRQPSSAALRPRARSQEARRHGADARAAPPSRRRQRSNLSLVGARVTFLAGQGGLMSGQINGAISANDLMNVFLPGALASGFQPAGEAAAVPRTACRCCSSSRRVAEGRDDHGRGPDEQPHPAPVIVPGRRPALADGRRGSPNWQERRQPGRVLARHRVHGEDGDVRRSSGAGRGSWTRIARSLDEGEMKGGQCGRNAVGGGAVDAGLDGELAAGGVDA